MHLHGSPEDLRISDLNLWRLRSRIETVNHSVLQITRRAFAVGGLLREAAWLFVTAAVLTACGGGGSGDSAPSGPANRAPTLDVIANETVAEGATVSVTVTAADADGDTLSLDINNLPGFISVVSVDATTWQLTTAPGFDDAGVYTMTAQVSDAGNLTAEVTFTLTVTNTNRPPILTVPSDATVNEGQSSNLIVSASDPDGDPIDITSTSLPAFATIADNGDGTASISLQPGFFASGAYTLTVLASDGSSIDVEANILIMVSNVNRAPVLDPLTPVTMAEGALVDVVLSATDPDADAISYTTTGAPVFATITTNGSGETVLRFTPQPLDYGIYNFDVRATDSGSPVLFDDQSIQLTVNLEGANHVAHETRCLALPTGT